jgi:hypothetical protein
VNYIIAKKSPVYGFVNFLSSKHQVTKKQTKEEALLLSTKNKAQDVDINESKKYMTPHEVKTMVNAFNHRKKKAVVMKYLNIYLTKLSLKIFRRYFAHKVVERIKDIFTNAAHRSYRKLKMVRKKLEILKEIKTKNGAGKLLQKLLGTKIKIKHKFENPNKRKVRGFIGIIDRKLPVFKTKILQRRKVKQEDNISTIPILTRSTTLISQSPSQMKVVRGKFNELSLKMRLEKKRENDKLKFKINKNQGEKKSMSSVSSKHLIQGIDRIATRNYL